MRSKAVNALLSISLLALLSGCAKPLTMHELVKQPYLQIPPNLLSECPIPEVPEEMTYGDSVSLNLMLIDSLDECNGKLRAISKIDENRASQ